MAELSTVARPYAEALFSAARDDKAGLPAWADLSGLPGEHGDESAIIARRLRAGGVEPAR